MAVDVTQLVESSMRFATPLTFAALGGLVSERAGVVNIGLEGMMLAGAFFAAVGSYYGHSPWVGLGCGIGAGMVLALVHAVVSIRYQADQIISGTAINLAALGGTSFLLNQIFGHPGSTPQVDGFATTPVPLLDRIPVVGPAVFGQSAFVWVSLLATVAVWYVLYRTVIGLRLRSSGEHPKALEAAGVNVVRLRYGAVLTSGMFCGVAGAFLSLSLLTAFSENMTAGRGFIALAAVIFGGWRPGRALAAAIFFGFADALVIRVPQNVLDPEFLYMIPYVATILALVLLGGRNAPPASVGRPYRPGSAGR